MTTSIRTRTLRPRDAATLIIIRTDGGHGAPQVLMGKRHEAHKFMPNKFVFPGGRVDPGDCRLKTADDLHPRVAEKLMTRMRGTPSMARARGLALAAVRETFEETGLVIGKAPGRPENTRSEAWRAFHRSGYSPALGGLRFFARAITPPGRPRRFDTRFFVTEAEHVANIDAPATIETDELLDPYWFTIEETRDLDLPWITGEILRRLKIAIEQPQGLAPDMSCTYQRMIGKNWHYEQI